MAKKKKKKTGDDDELKRKKKKRRREEEEDEVEETEEEEEVFETEEELTKPRRRQDLFVGFATLALLALIGATVFFAVEFDEVSQLDAEKKLGNPSLTVPTMAVLNKNIK